MTAPEGLKVSPEEAKKILDHAFTVIIPTYDLLGYLPLVCQLYVCSAALERPIYPVITDRWGVWHSLTEAVQEIERRWGVKEFRGMIVGSDTHIVNPEVLAGYIARADAEKVNFVCNIHMRGNDLKGIDGGFTVPGPAEGSPDVEDWSVVHPKGYGLYYGWLSTRYVWHSDAFAEEGSRFMSDNHIEVRLAKRVKLLHYVRRFT